MIHLIKILRNLCIYFLTRSKKMNLYSKVKELREELLKNCTYAIGRLKAAKEMVTYYFSQNQEVTRTNSNSIDEPQDSSIGTKGFENDTDYEITDIVIMKSFMELTHGVLIQEWEHFLREIFVEGVIHYLKGYDLGDPKYKISLKILKTTIEETERRKNISSEVINSLWGYDNLFKQSRKLFKIEECDLLNRTNKHIKVRHIFQHNRGEIRSRYLKEIGRESRYLEVFNDEGKPISYREGDTIKLSRPEIQDVYDTIEKCSEKFLTQAQSIVPLNEIR